MAAGNISGDIGFTHLAVLYLALVYSGRLFTRFWKRYTVDQHGKVDVSILLAATLQAQYYYSRFWRPLVCSVAMTSPGLRRAAGSISGDIRHTHF